MGSLDLVGDKEGGIEVLLVLTGKRKELKHSWACDTSFPWKLLHKN